MSFEVIEHVTRVEQECQERKNAAKAEALDLIAKAKQEAAGMMQQVRDAAVQEGKQLLQEAELRAEGRTAEIRKEAEKKSGVLREAAAAHLEEAAELIVGRVVKQ